MKKICALILALMLIFTATAALADLNWSDNEKNAAQIEGEYHTYDEPGLKCWIPTVLRQVELTEDDQKNGFIDYFATADNSSAVAVQYVSAGINTTEDYCTMLNTISEDHNHQRPARRHLHHGSDRYLLCLHPQGRRLYL